MSKQPLEFKIHTLHINDKKFEISNFDSIQDENREIPTDPSTKQVIDKIVISTKRILEDRFVAIYFHQGSQFPYSKTVIDIDSANPELAEETNPRPSKKIEIDRQSFVLIDVNKRKIYIAKSNREEILKWLEENLEGEIVIKLIISKEQFISQLKSLGTISFSATNNLFSPIEGILSKTLVQDMLGYGAEEAKIEYKYQKNYPIDQKIKNLLGTLFNHKDEFKDLIITGRNDENFESIFNLKEIAHKITIKACLDAKTKQFNSEEVFCKLIEDIQQHEKNSSP